MDKYILSRRLCNVWSIIVIVVERFALGSFPLEEAREHTSIFFIFINTRDISQGSSIFSYVIWFCTIFYVNSMKFWD
jgi:hypothetical protein